MTCTAPLRVTLLAVVVVAMASCKASRPPGCEPPDVLRQVALDGWLGDFCVSPSDPPGSLRNVDPYYERRFDSRTGLICRIREGDSTAEASDELRVERSPQSDGMGVSNRSLRVRRLGAHSVLLVDCDLSSSREGWSLDDLEGLLLSAVRSFREAPPESPTPTPLPVEHWVRQVVAREPEGDTSATLEISRAFEEAMATPPTPIEVTVGATTIAIPITATEATFAINASPDELQRLVVNGATSLLRVEPNSTVTVRHTPAGAAPVLARPAGYRLADHVVCGVPDSGCSNGFYEQGSDPLGYVGVV